MLGFHFIILSDVDSLFFIAVYMWEEYFGMAWVNHTYWLHHTFRPSSLIASQVFLVEMSPAMPFHNAISSNWFPSFIFSISSSTLFSTSMRCVFLLWYDMTSANSRFYWYAKIHTTSYTQQLNEAAQTTPVVMPEWSRCTILLQTLDENNLALKLYHLETDVQTPSILYNVLCTNSCTWTSLICKIFFHLTFCCNHKLPFSLSKWRFRIFNLPRILGSSFFLCFLTSFSVDNNPDITSTIKKPENLLLYTPSLEDKLEPQAKGWKQHSKATLFL